MLVPIQPQILWLILFGVMVVIELATFGLTTIWFAGGAMVSFLIALGGGQVYVQVIAFFAVSLVLMALIRPWASRHFNRDRVATNANELIGQTAVVLEDISNLQASGKVMINGMEWTARNASTDDIIRKDDLVTVKEISGVKLMVEKQQSDCK